MPTLRAARRAPPRRCSNNPLSLPPPATRSAPASKRHDPRPPHSLPASRAHARTPSCGRARTGAVGTRHPDTAISAHGAGTESPSPPCVPPPPSAAAAPGTAAASGAPAAAGGTYEASNLASSSGAKNCLQTRAGRCCQLRAEKKGAQAGATASNKRICGWTRSDAREARRCIGLAWADAWRPCAMCAYTTPCPGPFSRTRGGVQARRCASAQARTHLGDDGLAVELAAVQLFLGRARRRYILEGNENFANVLVRRRCGLAGRVWDRNDTRNDFAKFGALLDLSGVSDVSAVRTRPRRAGYIGHPCQCGHGHRRCDPMISDTR